MKRLTRGFVFAATGLLAVAVLAGCGSSDDDSSSEGSEATASTTVDSAGGAELSVVMDDYSYMPDAAETTAGSVSVSAPNQGDLPHELVIAKTNADPSKLPTSSDGSVDEEALDVPGEVSEIGPGETGTATIDLESGRYVMFCNLPGHYAAGMYGTLTVK